MFLELLAVLFFYFGYIFAGGLAPVFVHIWQFLRNCEESVELYLDLES